MAPACAYRRMKRHETRPQAFEQIKGGTFDVCVIGGGASGAGCALDAQLRGLKTVLVDAGDFASGSSTTSTKLAHGGVRYLEEGVSAWPFSQPLSPPRCLAGSWDGARRRKPRPSSMWG